jgi:uncharacterized membrane protein YphA (DoxX/SURF4 family)
MKKNLLLWTLRIVPALILFQTLYFKFSASPESVFIFSTLGIEPVGRIGSGIGELIAGLLILIPTLTFFGAAIGFGTMLVAVASHLFVLGIEVQEDGGLLFSLALIVLIFCGILMVVFRNQLLSHPLVKRYLFKH